MLEDDQVVGSAMRQWLEAGGHSVHHYTSGKAIVREAGRESFDLFLLDWHVPDLSGEDVLRWLREKQKTTVPVLFATSRDTEEDIVSALSAGADDYMIKPIRRMELLARVEALYRRMRPKVAETPQIVLSPYEIDLARRVVKLHDQPVEMTDKEYELTVFLFQNLGRLLSRGHISESVWGRTADVQSRTVDTHVSRVRKKLDFGTANGLRLSPVYNFGYRLERIAPETAPS
ncbi:MAG: response regulator transcription factor [Betaproteobacteria bacterium]|nr:response regulator transcription factor [Betaproteobacteria bacterium]